MNGQVYDGRFITLAEILARHGYETAAFVSGHPVDATYGLDRGFQTYQGTSKKKTPGDTAGRAAIEWLRPPRRSPFFLWIHLYDPHVPYAPPERLRRRFLPGPALTAWASGRGTSSFGEWTDVFDRTRITSLSGSPGDVPFFKNLNLYDAEVAFADEVVDMVVSSLRETHQLEQSLLVLLSDHGEGLGEHDFWSHGLHLYEEQIMIPLIFRFPQAKYAGTVVNEQVSLLDVMPTILEYLGLKGPPRGRGESLMRAISEEQRKGGRKFTFSETRAYPPRKPLSPEHWTAVRKFSVRTNSWKLIQTTEGKETLYNLVDDPEELTDRSEEERKQARQLRKALRRWLKSMPQSPATGPLELSDEDRRKLKSLGYVN